jgi:aspartyl protease family protein
MRTFGVVVAVLLALLASAAVLALLMGWEFGSDWGDTRGPQLVWTATIGAMLAAGIVGSLRQRASQTLFALLAWGGAFLLVILAYSYRAEFSALWARIRGEVLTSEVAVIAPGEVQVRRHADNHFYIDAEVNGGAVVFMVDTGASAVALSWKDAAAAGIDPAALRFDTRVQTASGPAQVAVVRIKRLAVGPIARANVEAIVLPEGVEGSLLGLAFLDTLTSYEISGDRLTLRD